MAHPSAKRAATGAGHGYWTGMEEYTYYDLGGRRSRVACSACEFLDAVRAWPRQTFVPGLCFAGTCHALRFFRRERRMARSTVEGEVMCPSAIIRACSFR